MNVRRGSLLAVVVWAGATLLANERNAAIRERSPSLREAAGPDLLLGCAVSSRDLRDPVWCR
ncbi:MAG: hypothetical protein QM691_14550 [Opitutaceae bacterium]